MRLFPSPHPCWTWYNYETWNFSHDTISSSVVSMKKLNLITIFFLPVFCHCRVEVSHSCRACSSSQHSQRWSHHPGNIQWHLDFSKEILFWQYFSYFILRQRGTSPLYLHWVLKQTNGKWTGKKSDIRDLDPLSHFTLASKYTLSPCNSTQVLVTWKTKWAHSWR